MKGLISLIVQSKGSSSYNVVLTVYWNQGVGGKAPESILTILVEVFFPQCNKERKKMQKTFRTVIKWNFERGAFA